MSGRIRITPTRTHVILGAIGIVLGALLLLSGAAGGLLFLLMGAWGLLLALTRWVGARRSYPPAAEEAREEPPVGRGYFALTGLGILAVSVYMFYLTYWYATRDDFMAVVAVLGGLLALALASYILGAALMWRRMDGGRGGRLAARLYPRLAGRANPRS